MATQYLHLAARLGKLYTYTMNTNGLNVEEIATKGNQIYEDVKNQYEPEHTGKFLAIDVESREQFLADTNSEAVEAAKRKYPEKIFYVVRIGYSATETLASMARI